MQYFLNLFINDILNKVYFDFNYSLIKNILNYLIYMISIYKSKLNNIISKYYLIGASIL